MKQITLLGRINQTKYNLAYPTLNEVLGIIKSGELVLEDAEFGKYRLKDAIDYIRKQPESDRQSWKFRLLPAVAYNGVFKEVSGQQLQEYSNITALDFDHIGTEPEMKLLYSRLVAVPYVYCVFVTPGGKGLKALVLHDNGEPLKHSDMYLQLLDKFNVASRDVNCKDLARRNYLSFDPDMWINQSAVPFHYEQKTVKSEAPVKNSVVAVKGISGSSILAIMNKTWQRKHPEYWETGNRASGIFTMSCMLCRWGVDEELALRYFIEGWECETMKADEIAGHVRNAYRRENFGTVPFTTNKY